MHSLLHNMRKPEELTKQGKLKHKRMAELLEDRELHELELKAKQEKALLEAKIEVKKEAAALKHELKMAGLGRHPR